MKTARIGCMVLGIALLMFVIAPYASAQPAIAGVWYKGTVSLKGHEIGSQTNIEGKDSGKGKMYVNILRGVDEYTVTTCVEDTRIDDVWNRTTTAIADDYVYGVMDEGETMIWDFFGDDVPMVFNYDSTSGPAVIYPMFTVKIKSSSVSFKSFACAGYEYSTGPFPFSLGSCKVSFKSIDALKVPTGATRCIRP